MNDKFEQIKNVHEKTMILLDALIKEKEKQPSGFLITWAPYVIPILLGIFTFVYTTQRAFFEIEQLRNEVIQIKEDCIVLKKQRVESEIKRAAYETVIDDYYKNLKKSEEHMKKSEKLFHDIEIDIVNLKNRHR